jgi:2,4-dienoyl-CoA reductase-like NADH-dependent reductase (Old Yellow Enzyme family)
VIRRVREEVGTDFPVLVKMNQTDEFPQGIQLEESVQIAQVFEKAGASAIIPSCGFTARTPFAMLRGYVPLKEMARNEQTPFRRAVIRSFGKAFVQRYPYNSLFLLEGARKIRDALDIPVIYVGGAVSLEDVETLIDEGFPFIQAGRATIRDPAFVNHLKTGEVTVSDCDHCNRCVAAMEGGGVYCVSEELGLLEG